MTQAATSLEVLDRGLDRPTIGAVLRERGHESGMCDEAKVAFAYELVVEAIRRTVIDRLDDVLTATVNDPRLIAVRLRKIADTIDPTGR